MSLPDLFLYEVINQLTKNEQRKLRLVSRNWKSIVDSFHKVYYIIRQDAIFLEECTVLEKVGGCITQLFLYCQDASYEHLSALVKLCPQVRVLHLFFMDQLKSSALLEDLNQILTGNQITKLGVVLYEPCDLSPLFKNVTIVKDLVLDFSFLQPQYQKAAFAGVELPELTNLEMILGASQELLEQIQVKFPKLTKLYFHNLERGTTQPQTTAPSHIASKDIGFPKLPHLKKLSFISNEKFECLTLPGATALHNLKSLELRFEQFKILKPFKTKENIWPNVEYLKLEFKIIEWVSIDYHFPNLKKLSVNGDLNGLFRKSTSELANLKKLASLSIYDLQAGFLIQDEPTLTELRELNICSDAYSTESVLSYCSDHLPNLIELRVGCVRSFTPMFSQFLQQEVRQFIKIKALHISVENEDVINLFRMISQVLPNLDSLEVLSEGQPLGDVSSQFTKFFYNLPNLTTFCHNLTFNIKQYAYLLNMAPKLKKISPSIDRQVLKQLREDGLIDPSRAIYGKVVT